VKRSVRNQTPSIGERFTIRLSRFNYEFAAPDANAGISEKSHNLRIAFFERCGSYTLADMWDPNTDPPSPIRVGEFDLVAANSLPARHIQRRKKAMNACTAFFFPG
jgi:hypothetical protein